jgi:hypothetical protein
MSRAAWCLLALGLLQMVGDGLERAGLPAIGQPLKALGAASTASPAPKVFSAVAGLETFSTRFFIEWRDVDGAEQSLELTPELSARIAGPYNRRNVYGAVLAYGPVLASQPRTAAMFRAVLGHALCGDAPLLVELGVDRSRIAGPVRVRCVPAPGTDTGNLPLVLVADCP